MTEIGPIAIFDSGVGGLTVASAIARQLPNEHLVYLGDTARLPYGTKSPETVTRYAVQATKALMRFTPKLVVVACNTASAVALPVLKEVYEPVPVIGVVDPGARAAVNSTRNGNIAVIATEGTVRGGAYIRAIHALQATASITQRACPLFVSLAEEGWTSGPIAELIAARYLDGLFGNPDGPDTLVLGCTHFPVLAGPIMNTVGSSVKLVDSAETTASEVALLLRQRGIENTENAVPPIFLSTDAPERFSRIGSQFFGEAIPSARVELVDLSA